MGILDAVGIVGGLASISGLIYAIYLARKTQRVKLLVYGNTFPVAIASAVSPEDDYNLSVIFKPTDGEEERLDSVHVRFLRFANLGREPVRRNDIAVSNPLRVEISGVRVLDLSLSAVSRDVNRIEAANQTYSSDAASADIEFDFLDYHDGGVIKILTVGRKGRARLCGDIIGMPEGIHRIEQLRAKRLLNTIGCGLAAVFELAAIGAVPLIFYWVTGTWRHVWLLVLPFVALFAPAVIIAIIASTIWPHEGPSFPDSLAIPEWARRLAFSQVRIHSRGSAGIFLEHASPDLEELEAEEEAKAT